MVLADKLRDMKQSLTAAMRMAGNPARNRDLGRLSSGCASTVYHEVLAPGEIAKDVVLRIREGRHVTAATTWAFAGLDPLQISGIAPIGTEHAVAARNLGLLIGAGKPDQLTGLVGDVYPGGWNDILPTLPVTTAVDEDGVPDELTPHSRNVIARRWDSVIRDFPDFAVRLLQAEAEELLGLAEPYEDEVSEVAEADGDTNQEGDIVEFDAGVSAVGNGPEIDLQDDGVDEHQLAMWEIFEAVPAAEPDDKAEQTGEAPRTSGADGVFDAENADIGLDFIDHADGEVGVAAYTEVDINGGEDRGAAQADVADGEHAGEPTRTGDRQPGESAAGAVPPSPPGTPAQLPPPDFEYLDKLLDEPILRRPLLFGHTLERDVVTGLVAAPAAGKTTYMMHVAVAVAANITWAGQRPSGPLRVIYANLEDNQNERRRRLKGIARHMGVTDRDALHRILVWCAGRMPLLAREEGKVVPTPMLERLRYAVRAHQADAVFIDPAVLASELDENSNPEMTGFVEGLKDLASECNCAIMIAHHTKKEAGNKISMDSARGASAFPASLRSMMMLVEAPPPAHSAGGNAVQAPKRVNLHWLKRNNGPLPEAPEVFERGSVSIENGDAENPPDEVGLLIPIG